MADTDDAPIIRAYIDRMLAIAASESEPDQATLEAIATELGLGPDDLQRAQTIATDHQTRARHYADVGHWDDALGELAQAIALRPGDPDLRMILAEAHAGRWTEFGHVADRQAAERAIRAVLAKEPDRQEAYGLLQRLDRPRSAGRRRLWAAMAVTAGFVGILALKVGWQRPTVVAGVVPVVSPIATEVPASRPAAPTGDNDPVTEMDVPFVWDGSGTGSDLHVVVRLSRLTRHRDPSLYNYAVSVTNRGRTVISKLVWRFAYLSQGGTVLKEATVEPVNAATVPVRPGDEVVAGAMLLVPRDTAAVRASVVMRDDVAAAASFDRSPVVPVVWSVPKPGHVAVEVRRRQESVSAFIAGGKKNYEGHFELVNTGKGAIAELDVAADLLDRQNHLLKTVTKSVVYGKGRDLPPGHVRTFEIFDFLGSTRTDHARIRITDVR